MTASEKPWTPDLPLGSSATKDDLDERHAYLCRNPGPSPDYFPMWEVARELASAVSGEKDREIARLRNDLENLEVAGEMQDAEIARLREQLAAYEQNHGWVSAEVFAAVRKDNEQKNALYYELLYAVAQKFPNETRHQTALRYITEREANALTSSAKETK